MRAESGSVRGVFCQLLLAAEECSILHVAGDNKQRTVIKLGAFHACCAFVQMQRSKPLLFVGVADPGRRAGPDFGTF